MLIFQRKIAAVSQQSTKSFSLFKPTVEAKPWIMEKFVAASRFASVPSVPPEFCNV